MENDWIMYAIKTYNYARRGLSSTPPLIVAPPGDAIGPHRTVKRGKTRYDRNRHAHSFQGGRFRSVCRASRIPTRGFFNTVVTLQLDRTKTTFLCVFFCWLVVPDFSASRLSC